MAKSKRAPALSKRQKQKIQQVLTPYKSRGLTASQIISRMGNLRGKSNIGQIRRFLDENSHKRDVKNAQGTSLYTEKPSWEQDNPEGPRTFADMTSKAFD